MTLAGLRKLIAQGKVGAEDSVVLLLTGHTLKDPDYTIQYHRGEWPKEAPGDLGSAIAATRRNAVRIDASVDGVLSELERFGR